MASQNNRKKNILPVKIISIIAFLGVLIALIVDTAQLIDIFKSNKEPKIIEVTPTFKADTTKSVEKKPKVNQGEPDKKINEKIAFLLEEARRVKSKSPNNSRTKYLEAYELLPESQKNRQFINSINYSTSSIDFVTQNNLLDSIFVSLKYLSNEN